MSKKILHSKVFFYFSAILAYLLINTSLCFATDFTSVSSGNWNSYETWGGTLLPTENDNVFITPGHTITVTETATINSINFLNTGSSPGTLAVIDGTILNVIGEILLQNSSNLNTKALIQGGGKIKCLNIIVGSTIKDPSVTCSSTLTSSIFELEVSGNLLIKSEVNAGALGHSFFYLSSGSVIIKGSIVLDADKEGANGPSSALDLDQGLKSGNLDLAGETPFLFLGSGVKYINLNGSGSTVRYSRLGDQDIYKANYRNLKLSGSGIKEAPAVKDVSDAVKVNGTLTIDEGVILNQATCIIEIPTSGSLIVKGTLDFTSSIGMMISNGKATKLGMGPNGFIRTMDHAGLGKTSEASFQRTSTTDWDLSSISTNGSIEYYCSNENTLNNLINMQMVTDLDYNNLIISGTMHTKKWNLGSNRTVNGNITISPNAPFLLASEYTIFIKGNWLNNGVSFDPGFGTICFNGTVMQNISGSSESSFNNLIIDNASGVMLTQSTNVKAELSMNRGLLTIPVSKTLTLQNSSSLPIQVKGAPFGAAKHIVTQVDKNGYRGTFQVNNILANSNFLFPVGNGEYYLPATIKPDQKNDYGVTVFTGFTADGKPGVPLDEAQRKNVVNVIWEIKGNKNVSSEMSLNWPKDQNLEGLNVLNAIKNGESLGISQYGNGYWNAASGIYNVVQNTVTRTNISTFTSFGVALIGEVSLPVHFADVKASAKPTGILLEFTNLTESDVSYYEIERSTGGQIFYPVKRLAPSKNDYNSVSYAWLDVNCLAGMNVYRVKAVETSGKSIYSNLVSITNRADNDGMEVFAKGLEVISRINNLPAGKYCIRIINIAGQVIQTEKIDHSSGTLNHSTLLNNAKAGIYIYDVQGSVQMQKKFFVR